jgi:hypothetical protein
MAGYGWTIDPSGVNLNLADGTTFVLLEQDAPAPASQAAYLTGPDIEGGLPQFTSHDNRTITLRVRATAATDAALATVLTGLQAAVAKLHAEGGVLRFTSPAGDTGDFTVHDASVTTALDRRLMTIRRAEVTLTFTCGPYAVGPEVDLGDNTETTLPYLAFTEASLAGDVPGVGRLVIDNDQSSTTQRDLMLGLRSRYNDAGANAALFYEAESRASLGGTSLTTESGASGGGTNVMQFTRLTPAWQAFLSTNAASGGAAHTHVGRYRVIARVLRHPSAAGALGFRWTWAVGGAWRNPVVNDAVYLTFDESISGDLLPQRWYDIDLGIVTIPPAIVGTQSWEGRLEARSSVDATLERAVCDCYWLVPVDECAGNASASLLVPSPSAYSAWDGFDQGSGNLAGQAAPIGGTWAGSGDTDDFVCIGSGASLVRRTAVSDSAYRWNRVPVTMTDCASVALVKRSAYDASAPGPGPMARHTTTNNDGYFLSALQGSAGGVVQLILSKRVSGSISNIGMRTLAAGSGLDVTAWTWLGVAVFSDGWIAVGAEPLTTELTDMTFPTVRFWVYDADAATGGANASGAPGIFDHWPGSGACTREVARLAAWAPSADLVCGNAGSVHVRSDGVVRTTSGAAAPVTWRGDLLRVPPAGPAARTTQILVKMSRGHRISPRIVDDPAIDDLSARLYYQPRYLQLPD